MITVNWGNTFKNLISNEIIIGMGAGAISKSMRELKSFYDFKQKDI